jgi:serine/threonine-protein kinase SRPK3
MFVVGASLRTALQNSPYRKLVPSPLSPFRSPHFTFMSTSLAPNVKRPFDESSTSVRINDKEDGEELVCDEEPHMLSPEQGFGYPITLGQKLGEGKLEIVRNSDGPVIPASGLHLRSGICIFLACR